MIRTSKSHLIVAIPHRLWDVLIQLAALWTLITFLVKNDEQWQFTYFARREMINDPKDSAHGCSADGGIAQSCSADGCSAHGCSAHGCSARGCSADGVIAHSCSAHSSSEHGCREHSCSESVTKLFSDTVNESELPDELKLADITATFENDNPTE